MTRLDDLRRMREARFAAVEKKQRADSVTNNPPAVARISVTPKPGRGRPKTGKALSAAEKMRRYRARTKAAGERAKG